MLLGCIADDLTGATDLGDQSRARGPAVGADQSACPSRRARRPGGRRGRRGAQVADDSARPTPSRSRWRRSTGCGAQGAQRIYFKYCSTFDSTPHGNIGPVTEALLDALRRGRRHRATPGLSAQQAHRLPRPPVRRRRAAVRYADAQPSADADDRRQPGARARRADRGAAVGLVAAATLDAGVDAVRARLAALAGGRHGACDRRRDRATST